MTSTAVLATMGGIVTLTHGPSVYLFREFELYLEPRASASAVGQKARLLLAYLLLNHQRPFRREQLMAMLWPESSEQSARKNLRQTLWQLRRELGPVGDRVLVIDSETLAIGEDAPLVWDVHLFRQVERLVLKHPLHEMTPARLTALKRGVELYRGDLLEGWDEEWCWIEREALRALYQRMLDRLMDLCLARHEPDQGFYYGRRALRVDPARERTYRRLMRLHGLIGDRSGALRQYQRCREALAEELGVEPDRQTRALAEQIRADEYRVVSLLSFPRRTTDEPELAALNVGLTRLLNGKGDALPASGTRRRPAPPMEIGALFA